MNDYKTIPFDIKKAKTLENPNGLKVVTKDGKSARIICTDKRGEYPIVALIKVENFIEVVRFYSLNGKISYNNDSDELFLKEPVKQRRMTNMELSKWLREKPEEFREAMTEHHLVKSDHSYFQEYENHAVENGLTIRSNYGEWKEPLIEE